MNEHGTIQRYRNDRCRCDLCRAANAATLRHQHRVKRPVTVITYEDGTPHERAAVAIETPVRSPSRTISITDKGRDWLRADKEKRG
jgi:hypothetical protein